MLKQYVLTISRILRPHLQRKETCYRNVVPIVVKVACALYKLTQGASLLHCSEMFAIGKWIVCLAI
jgi:hypothetical protein